MKKSTPLDVLMPKTRHRVLTAIFEQPEQWQYLTGLAKQLRARPSSLFRELTRLVKAGIIERRRQGHRVYFRAAKACPFYTELAGLLHKAGGKRSRRQ
jgi:DNA-binding MarR family transcriptional regulator